MPKISRIASAIVEANFQWTYVRVYSDADGGLYGTGECFFAPGAQQIVAEFSSILVGEDPDNIDRLVEKMRWAASGAGSVGGLVWNAITGIETALWDMKGKRLGSPVWMLLGGKFRERARLYLDCHAAGALECLSPLLQPRQPKWAKGRFRNQLSPSESISASADRAKQMAVLGYTALKFDLDLPGSSFDCASGYSITSRDVDWMVELATAIRRTVGPDVDLAFDAHWRYRPHEILVVAREMESLRLLWLEDPCPPHDFNGLRYLRDHTSTPIGTGENLQLREGFWRLIAEDLCSVVLPDLQKAGGLSEGRKIADLAATANKPFSPHMIGSPLALMASCHLALTIPNFQVCEYHAHDVPFFHDLVQGGTTSWFSAAGVTPSERPGFGIELDESVARRWQLPGTRWFDE
jgi:L-alanine-DL-glutamate epimerase-like enolase superfamily enzyme